MERPQKDLSMASVAAGGSLLLTFGLVQGALYLKAYWGHFGLDPFQFVAVGELALAGLAGIGFMLALMLLAMLGGGLPESRLTNGSSKRKLFAALAAIVFFAGVGCLIWMSDGWPLVLGFLLTIAGVLILQLSPVIPRLVKDSPWLVYFVAMIAYGSIASSWLGFERAKSITDGGGKYVASVSLEGKEEGGLTLIGRLGDCYALWDPVRKATSLIPVTSVERLELAGKGLPRLSSE